jgi:hypothetical protein
MDDEHHVSDDFEELLEMRKLLACRTFQQHF